MKRIVYLIFLSALMLGACVEEFNAQLPEGEKDILVVDGTIISDSLCTFYVSRTQGGVMGSDSFLGEPLATLKVLGSDGTEWQGKQVRGGEFEVQVGSLLSDVAYHVEVQVLGFKGLTYTSKPMKALDTPQIVDSIGLERKNNKFEENVLLYMSMRGPGNLYYRVSYLQDWEVRAEWNAMVEYDRKTGLVKPVEQSYARGWKSDHSERPYVFPSGKYEAGYSFPVPLYSVSLTSDHLSYRYCSTICVRSVSREEYEYEKIRNQLSNSMGGLFTSQPSQLPTNLTCSDPSVKVIGFVGVSGKVVKKRFYISTKEVDCLYNEIQGRDCEALTMNDRNTDRPDLMYDWGYRLVSDNPMLWAPKACVDIRQPGVSLEKPDWWEDN